MKQYVVDAFTDKVFAGNPAAICILDKWLPDKLMMNITIENNLSETAFAVKETSGKYKLRWFTPGGEIDLCGHATLATAFVITQFYEQDVDKIVFSTLSGDLSVEKNQDLYELNFPAYKLKPVAVTPEMTEAIGATPTEAYIGRDLLCVFNSADIIKTMKPDMTKVKQLNGLLLHVTAPGENTDCISRSFAPKLNVNEDPVCGSGHCHIAPYWLKKLHKDKIFAYQASKRGGYLYCSQQHDRITLAGKAALFSIADLNI